MDIFNENKVFSENEILSVPSTTLAFVGDAYFTYEARLFVLNGNFKSGQLHKKATEFVKAEAQSKFLKNLLPILTESEIDIAKRARNTHTQSKSKNASLSDYKKATAFEALIGYLILTGKKERLRELMKIVFTKGEQV